ncbi:MAG: recombinase family protein [Selenomonadaceae bacterium]|nr:recombinase family protein [Selenomonadaceae bacterium]
MTETEKFDIVLVYKLDRLSRSQRDTLYLIEEIFLPNKVDFVSMQESFDTSSPFGKAMIGLLAVFAQLEREQIKERTKMGKRVRAKAGLHHGAGFIPIGYNYQDGKLIVNPYEAEQVKKIYEWYLGGLSLQSIANRLHEAGYTNRYSSYSTWSSIRNILSNITYTGRLHYGEVIVVLGITDEILDHINTIPAILVLNKCKVWSKTPTAKTNIGKRRNLKR